MPRLDKKVILVAATSDHYLDVAARALIAEGANVSLALPAGLAPGAAANLPCYEVIADSDESWKSACDQVVAEHGQLDALLTLHASAPAMPLAATSLAEFQAAATTSVDMVFASNRAAILAMRACKGEADVGSGAIVNVTSFASHTGLRSGGMLNAIAAGVWNLSRQLGVEVGENGEMIRINSVHTGPDAEEAQALGIDSRFVFDAGESLADAIIYLLSDEARLVSAADIVLDNGLTAGI